jgi:hypothetical protein
LPACRSADGPPLDYEARHRSAAARGPWWKFRWQRWHLPGAIFAGLMMMITAWHALYVENLRYQRSAPAPTTPPASSRPTINIHLPPT